MRSQNKVASRRRRKKMLKHAKGYWGRKKNVWTVAKNQIEKGWQYAYRDRRNKKREFRRLWIQRINAAARIHGTSYSRLMGLLKEREVELNRKALADLAMNHPDAFKAIIDLANDPNAAGKGQGNKKAAAPKAAAPAPAPKAPAAEEVASEEEE